MTCSYLPCGCLILPSMDMGTKNLEEGSIVDQAKGTELCKVE
jgi:hypothetical protein